MANCSAPCGPIWPKFHVVNGNDSNFVWPGRGMWEQWPKNRNGHQVIQAKLADYDYKLTQNISHNIQSPMKPYQAVLYIKKKVRHRSITTSKYIKFRQPRPEIRGVSKISLTVRHPVELGESHKFGSVSYSSSRLRYVAYRDTST